MTIHIKHQSQETDRGQDRLTDSITYYGPEEELKAYASTLKIGNAHQGLNGAITSVRVAQEEGGIWRCEVACEINYDDSGNPSDPSSSTGPNSQRLSCTRLSLDLNQHKKYRASWDHQLIANLETLIVPTVPSWFLNATDLTIPDNDVGNYRWIEPGDEIPENWVLLCDVDPRMKGMKTFDWSVYTITETGKHGSKNQTAWVAASALNSIVDEPMLGDFGLTAKLGGNWKVDDANVYFDGKNWVADLVYTKSGDDKGWNAVTYGDEDPTHPNFRDEG